MKSFAAQFASFMAAPFAAAVACTAADVAWVRHVVGVRWIGPAAWCARAGWALGVYLLFSVGAAAAGRGLWLLVRNRRWAKAWLERALRGPGIVFAIMATLWTAAVFDASLVFDAGTVRVYRSLLVWTPALLADGAVLAWLGVALYRQVWRRRGLRRCLMWLAVAALSVVAVLALTTVFAEFAIQRGAARFAVQSYAARAGTMWFSLSRSALGAGALWLFCFGGCGLLAGAAAFAADRFLPRVSRGLAAALCVAALAGLGVVAARSWRAQPPARAAAGAKDASQSVVLLTVDALRADYVSSYGAHAFTPNIGALAKRGVVFANATTAAPWTRPSFASLLLSAYPTVHGVGEQGIQHRRQGAHALPDRLTSLPEAFQAAGYTTQAFVSNSQLHRAFHFDRGFDDYVMYEDVGARTPWLTLEEAARPELMLVRRARRLLKLEPIYRRRHADEDARRHSGAMLAPADVFLVARAIEWVRTAPRPFFLWVHLIGVHDYGSYHFQRTGPPRARAPMARLIELAKTTRVGGPIMSDPYVPQYREDLRLAWPAPWTLSAPAAAEIDMAHYAQRYADNLQFVDAALGCLLDELQAQGLLGRGHVAFSSDHGEEFGEHEGGWHGRTQYQEVVHVPLILVSPTFGARAEQVRPPCSSISLAPTLLYLAGLPVPATFMGKSLAPLVAGQETEPRPVHSEFLDDPARERKARREGDMKCITSGGGHAAELYDLAKDPWEKHNLAQDNPYLLREMLRRLHAWERRQAGVAKKVRQGRKGRVTITEEMGEMLRRLGYED